MARALRWLGGGLLGLIALGAGVWAVGQAVPALSVHIDWGDAPATPSVVAGPAGRIPGTAPATHPGIVTPAAWTATPAPLPAGTPGALFTYVVQPGDTLSDIALRYGTTVEALQTRNGIADPNVLFAGARLAILPGEQAAIPATALPPAPTVAAPAAAAPTLPPAAVVGAATPATMDALEPPRPAQPPSAYDVYIPTASKSGQWYHYTCEFDAAWVVFKTYGLDVSLDDQVQIIGLDTSVTPTYKQTPQGVEIDGGDIALYYSGDYKTNFLARTTGEAMQKVFAHYGLDATPVHDQAGVEAALRAGQLVWIKTTADFKRWVPATWVGPDGRRYATVLGNDHAVVVAGFNARAAVIRDVLGPTSTNAHRLLEYEVPWPTFLAAWGAQADDGLAVARPG